MTKQITLRSKRIFTEEFKKSCVKDYESGQFSVLELSKLYSIQKVVLYRWIDRFA